jgi:integrase
MSSIYRRNEGLYIAQFVEENGKQKYLYARKRKDVKAKLAAALEAQEQGLKQGADKITLSKYLAYWLSSTESTVSESSYALRKLYASKHISPALGHIKLSELDAMTVQTFYQDKHKAGMKPQTVKRMHATLSKALFDAVKFKLVAEEVQRLFDAAVGDRFECFYTLAVTCGLRAGENIGLRWSDINFDAGTLTVRRAIHNCKIKPLKSVRSYRVIKLSRTALTALSKQKANQTVDSEPTSSIVATGFS